MGGRHAKPVGLHLADKKTHLTRQQIKDREEAEIKLGAKDFAKLKPPTFVKNDVVAYKQWQTIIKDYKDAAKNGVDLITSSDVGVLALYCKTYSEYESLLKIRQRLDRIQELETDVIEYSRDFETELRDMIRDILSVDGLLKLDTAVNRKMDMLLKMQDRLFLNPLAKIKNVPKPKAPEKPDPFKSRFGNI